MLKALVGQVTRLFSSKNNGGRLVCERTDRLHYYKQVLLALSIALLLGYSNFREHFKCQTVENLDIKSLTNFCWINGTTTLDLKNQDQSAGDGKLVPHVGLNFKVNDKRYELVNHNYMRSLWALLLILAFCSFLAQRQWASIFASSTLRALLKLPGYKELPAVKRAQEAKPYEKLAVKKALPLPSSPATGSNAGGNFFAAYHAPSLNLGTEKGSKQDGATSSQVVLHLNSQLFNLDRDLDGEENEHNRRLEYYPNQLIYLLLANKESTFRLLRIRRKLVTYSVCSFLLTLLQFILPCLLIGEKYRLYGLRIFKAWLKYVVREFIDDKNRPRSSVNSVDYALSSRIWPISTQCEFKQYGLADLESVVVQCTVAINEICGKLFAIIWWFVIINIMIEFYMLIGILISSIHFELTKRTLGWRYWRRARREADEIATFNYRHAALKFQAKCMLARRKQQPNLSSVLTTIVTTGDNGGRVNNNGRLPLNSDHPNTKQLYNEALQRASNNCEELSEVESKQLEATTVNTPNHGDSTAKKAPESLADSSLGNKKWYLWCSRDIGLFFASKFRRLGQGRKSFFQDSATLAELDELKELKQNADIYYLFYLLYLRLGRSQRKVEQVIRMTSVALSHYLESLRLRVAEQESSMEAGGHFFSPALDQQSASERREEEQSSSSGTTTSGKSSVDTIINVKK